MPNYFAHLTFGRAALEGLPSPLKMELEGERPAFELGCLGPDILFFYRPFARSAPQREGMEMHERSALPVFQRLRAAVEDRTPMSGSYAAGFLCHLALDSACHPYVNGVSASGRISHLAMEAEFDRLLIERAGLTIRDPHLPPPCEAAVYRAASRAFCHADPRALERGFLAMRRDAGLLARLCGTRLGRFADCLCRRIGPLREMAGVILGRRPDPACEESNRVLLELTERAVPTAVEQIGRFFSAIGTGAPLDSWLDRDFEGTDGQVEERCPE